MNNNKGTQPYELLKNLPDPKVVQERLAENLREARLLRQMLRLTRKAAEQRQSMRKDA